MAGIGAPASLVLAVPNDGFAQAQWTLPSATSKVGVAPKAAMRPPMIEPLGSILKAFPGRADRGSGAYGSGRSHGTRHLGRPLLTAGRRALVSDPHDFE